MCRGHLWVCPEEASSVGNSQKIICATAAACLAHLYSSILSESADQLHMWVPSIKGTPDHPGSTPPSLLVWDYGDQLEADK